jgi:hypothetical protein
MEPIYEMTFSGHASDGYFRAQKEKGSLGIIDARDNCGGQGLLMCRCLESDWTRLSLQKWPDTESIACFRKRVAEIRRDHGLTWEGSSVMGYHNPDRGDLKIPDVPLYRFIRLAPYVSPQSDELHRSMGAEIWTSIEECGGQLIGGFSSVEERWGSFFVEAFQSFDGILKHVKAMRELMRRYKVAWSVESFIGVRWE